MKRIGAIIQARMGSTRFPGKVLYPLFQGIGSLEIIIKKLQLVYEIDQIIVATPSGDDNMPIWELCEKLKIDYFKGSENDVLQRVCECAVKHRIEWIIDITADCPFIPLDLLKIIIKSHLIDESISLKKQLIDESISYISNTLTRSFADGFDIQTYRTKILYELNDLLTKDNPHRIHTGWSIINYSCYLESFMKAINKPAPIEYFNPDQRLVLDNKEDAILISKIMEYAETWNPSIEKIYEVLENHPELLEINKGLKSKTPGCD